MNKTTKWSSVGPVSYNFRRWRWYKSPDLYHYQHVSDVCFLNIFALLMRLETRKCWYKSGDLYQLKQN